MEHTVKHEEKYQQFTINFGNEDEAELAYATPQKGVMVFTHTYVPAPERGKGIVQKLMEVALRYALENNFDVRATCPVAAKYLERLKA